MTSESKPSPCFPSPLRGQHRFLHPDIQMMSPWNGQSLVQPTGATRLSAGKPVLTVIVSLRSPSGPSLTAEADLWPSLMAPLTLMQREVADVQWSKLHFLDTKSQRRVST